MHLAFLALNDEDDGKCPAGKWGFFSIIESHVELGNPFSIDQWLIFQLTSSASNDSAMSFIACDTTVLPHRIIELPPKIGLHLLIGICF